jgi:hypothetical protein
VKLLLFLLIPFAVHAQEVARVFGVPLTTAELGQPAARQLKERVLKEAIPRFVAANKLHATPPEIAAYQRWEADFQRIDKDRRAQRLAQIDQELQQPAMDESKRRALIEQRDVLLSLARHDQTRPRSDASTAARVHAQWIEGYKVKKALYEQYGGRVGITKWGPDPAGATEALLREHEKRGELQISDTGLAKEFWDALAREPRMPASKPEHYDFTYYWLKPPPR